MRQADLTKLKVDLRALRASFEAITAELDNLEDAILSMDHDLDDASMELYDTPYIPPEL